MNKVELAGTVYNQITTNVTQSGKFVSKFMLKINNKQGKGFKLIPITFWSNTQSLGDIFSKDASVKIEGAIDTGSYEKEGKKIYTWGVTAYEIEKTELPRELGEQE